MQWLPDTGVVFGLTRKAPDAQVLQRFGSSAVLAVLAVKRLGDIQTAIESLSAGRNRCSRQLWSAGLLARYASFILAIDLAVWRVFGHLKAWLDIIGKPQENHDLLIAATATAHRLTLVTAQQQTFSEYWHSNFQPLAQPLE